MVPSAFTADYRRSLTALHFSGRGRLRNTDGRRGATDDVGVEAAVLMRSKASLSVPGRNSYTTFKASDCLTSAVEVDEGAPLETMLKLC